jgi:hypothetical protein
MKVGDLTIIRKSCISVSGWIIAARNNSTPLLIVGKRKLPRTGGATQYSVLYNGDPMWIYDHALKKINNER